MLYRSVMLDDCKALKLVEYLGGRILGNVNCEDRSWCQSENQHRMEIARTFSKFRPKKPKRF